jgi:hypothetical protein
VSAADLAVGTVLRSTRTPSAEWRITNRAGDIAHGWQVQNCNIDWAKGFIPDEDIDNGLWEAT